MGERSPRSEVFALRWTRAEDIAELPSTWRSRTVIMRLSAAKPLILEGTGVELWRLTETCSDLEQMLNELAEVFPGLPLDEAGPQVERFVRSLLLEGFLQYRDVVGRESTASGGQ